MNISLNVDISTYLAFIIKKRAKKTAYLGGRACFFATLCVATLPVVSEIRYECL